MRIAIYGREFQPSVIPHVKHLFEYLVDKNIEIWVYDPFHEFLISQFECAFNFSTYNTYQEIKDHIDIMLSLGGDGTMLSAVSLIKDSGIPIAGINFGRLGFLASINKNDFEDAIDDILNQRFTIQKRVLLSVESEQVNLFQGNHYALNDITVFRYDSSAMITVNARINGELLNSYWADGLIIATPTGSTAYSLSCGGPIIMPESGNFVITPISPHNLNVRPIVISNQFTLELEIESRSNQYILSCDSKNESIDTSVKLTIKQAPFTINLIRLPHESFFSTLREKLLWGIDVRNY
ncbi:MULTISPECIES: NAD kinase [Sphingobacterium]|uniref:NAD kinase n=1 Tax=Sphingobacterium paramultivorum TaxID=2886510 RepID=A0A7G5E394_9SPHI|nr:MULTISPECIES: NAD kinase [Sphingobacterium]MBB1642393.1 NAD kinase [Sphingobacterium sp. UME9]MCS4165958.1 NAD+ kinase [Sphingobacterium sp. BIGb0116]QMV68469.1 NAD kinase [Sphingobacterium paramultivorum]WET69421.1 MAG: NAD kinase [Sphingobacterium sp.]WSO17408.1 NAD kinase [Sphingobacterium paramultivorum]